MARKKKKKYAAEKEAKRRARILVGQPPGERVIPDKRKKPPKHKETLSEQEGL